MKQVAERQLKWDVDERFALPRLDGLVAGADVDRSTLHLETTYYDTADADLQSFGARLRRVDVDGDVSWRLTLPRTDEPIEIRDSSSTPPAAVTDMLAGVIRGKPLSTITTIRTERDRYRITEPKRHRLCAEVDDDRVHASVDHRLLAWREIDVDLGPGAKALRRPLADLLADAGATPSAHPSKLARVATPRDTRPARAGTPDLLLTSYLNEQIDTIVDGDIGLRRGEDPIHDTRVAIRRLRSTLRVFGKLLNQPAAEHVEAELKWFAGVLGEVRDCQVQRARFDAALAGLPPELVLGPVAARIDGDLLSEQLRARQCVAEAMQSARYLDLLTTLRGWRADPPIAATPTHKALDARARKAERKADRRLIDAVDGGDDTLLHRARKAAKRARYAAELRAPGVKRAKATVKRYKRIQQVLGDHQDGVVATATLRRLALVAGTTPGENGFTFGLLHAREQQAADEARARARELIG